MIDSKTLLGMDCRAHVKGCPKPLVETCFLPGFGIKIGDLHWIIDFDALCIFLCILFLKLLFQLLHEGQIWVQYLSELRKFTDLCVLCFFLDSDVWCW